MIHFTKRLSGLLIAGILFVTACKSNDTVPLPENYYALIAGQSVNATMGIVVTADTVNVSICPPGAACLVANNAGAVIRLSKASQNHSVKLWAYIPNYNRHPGSPFKDSTAVDFDGQLYKVILRNGSQIDGPENSLRNQVVIQVSAL